MAERFDQVVARYDSRATRTCDLREDCDQRGIMINGAAIGAWTPQNEDK